MSDYKICKFVDVNGSEWYQIKKKGWFFWHYVSAYPQLSRKAYPVRFDNMEEVNQHIKFDSAIQKGFQIKKVKCWEENHG